MKSVVMKRIIIGGALLALIGLGVVAWLLGLFTAEPDEVSITETIAEVQAASTAEPTEDPAEPTEDPAEPTEDIATPEPEQSPDATATPALAAADTSEAADQGNEFLAGDWMVQADDLTFVGYRADSQAGEAVGRSRGVTGTLTATASTVTAVDIVVDMTIMSSDSRLRDDHLGTDGFEYRTYPTSMFSLAEPIDVPTIPAPGVEVPFTATGDLTVRDITKTVTLDLQAAIVGDQLIIVGSTNIVADDFGASISDITEAIMEFSLIFVKS